MNCFQLCTFIIGIVFGVYTCFILFTSEEAFPVGDVITISNNENGYKAWSREVGLQVKNVNVDRHSFGDGNFSSKLESKAISDAVKLTCVIFVTKPSNAFNIANTWGKKCDTTFFYSNKDVPMLDVRVHRGKDSWPFLCDTIRTVASHDWVVFNGDDVYVIPENLRYALIGLNPDHPYYFGHNLIFWGVVYNTRRTSYVLSRGAMKAISEKFNSTKACSESGKYKNNEDYLLGKYLGQLGIKAMDLRDNAGRHRFHYFTPSQLMAPGDVEVIDKYSSRSLFPVIQGENCCSSTSVSFISQGDSFLLYKYLLYEVRIFNYFGGLGNNKTKVSTRTDDVWKEYVYEKMGIEFDISLMTDKRYDELWQLFINPDDFPSLVKMEGDKLKTITLEDLGRT